MKYQTPYRDLVPPLSTEEKEILAADLKANKQQVDALTDEDGNILDGHHRFDVLGKSLKVRVVKGLTESEKRAMVVRLAVNRRNLSPAQKDEVRRRQKEIAFALRTEDAKKWTQAKVAAAVGVARNTVSDWFTAKTKQNGRSNVGSDITSKPYICTTCGHPRTDPGHRCKPDARVKINPTHKPVIAERVAKGEPQAQVAADYGVSQKAVSNVIREENKKQEVKAKREESAKKRTGNCGIIQGDFRVALAGEDEASIDLIFTDPPYDEGSAELYADIAKLAASKLCKGGWLLAYTGQFHLPAVIKAFAETPGLEYAWTFAVIHSGGDQRIRKYKLLNGWKPVVAAFRPPLQVDWEWFRDCVSGGKEKEDHEWQQSESEAAHFIERLCPVGGLVVDPCCGSGTTLAAAKGLKRRWLGVELSDDHVETARAKLE